MMRAIDLASVGVVGFRFHPTDEELVDHYMKLKMLGRDDEVSEIIPEIDICKFEPWELPGLSQINTENDTLWYFFCRPDYKYTNSKRFNRTTKEGFWKVTGKDRMIKGGRMKKVIGIKKTLVFHENSNNPKDKAIKTSWVIHEYHSKVKYQREIVLCRLKYKHDDKTDISSSEEGEPSQQHLVYDLENGADDDIMGEADGSRLDEIMAQFQSLIDPNQNSYTFSDELLRSMIDTPEPERPQMFVNSFSLDQDAYSHEGASLAAIFRDYSPSESSSRVRIRERSPRFADYEEDNYMFEAQGGLPSDTLTSNSHRFADYEEANYMFEPQGGLPSDTLTSNSQNRSQAVIAHEPYRVFQADFGDSVSKVTSRIMHRHKQGGGSSTSHNEPESRNYEEVEPPVPVRFQGRCEMYSPPKAASKNKAKEAEGQGDTDDLKGSMVVESNKSSKMAESSSRSSKSKSPSPQAPGRHGKNWFIVMESSPLNLIEEPPPSVYIAKVVLGIFLFVVFLRELMVLH
ncbi:protein NTM1-like 9 isoform X2 [Tripterygium wilfordii]|uniref:protein NTM1-like 9 isoform X2 n=1 Tax=Tripterygium wilfordii TaxID=458696 RepID=UPI0018F85478|nr:protein NTM1-like 9 isoform X2 [Tripterygium wilfordii]